MNTVMFCLIAMAWQAGTIWLAYRIGHDDGWLDGWDDRRS